MWRDLGRFKGSRADVRGDTPRSPAKLVDAPHRKSRSRRTLSQFFSKQVCIVSELNKKNELVFERPHGVYWTFVAGSLLAVLGLGWAMRQTDSSNLMQMQLAAVLSMLALAAAGCGALAGFMRTSYRMDTRGIECRRAGSVERVEWEQVSSFSETEATHRESDLHCFLKSREGEPLMAIAPHMVGRQKHRLLDEVRSRIGPPTLSSDGAPEVFRFGDFGPAPPLEFRLEPDTLAVSAASDEVRVPYKDILRIEVAAWPKVGEGMERARVFVGEQALEVDSRVIGFWPLLDYLASRCPHAEIEDMSRRNRVTGRRLGGEAAIQPE